MPKTRTISVLFILMAVFILATFSGATTTRPGNSEMTAVAVRASPTPTPKEPARTPAQDASKPETVMKSVQIFLDVEADVLIENSDGKRIGQDLKTNKFVNEIPEARVVSRETSATYVLPFDTSGKPYLITISGKSTSKVDADLSMTGAGFVVGFHSIPLKAGQVQKLSIASNGLHMSFTASQEGPTPQLFLTSQSGRGKPSYRFEVLSSLLNVGKTIMVDLDPDKGRLYFKTDAVRKDNFSVKMRRTNPGGARDMFARQNISFGRTNSYTMDFGQWDGKGGVCFYENCESCTNRECTKLENESGSR